MWEEACPICRWAVIQQPILRLLTSALDFRGASSAVVAFPMFEKNRLFFSKDWTANAVPREDFLRKYGDYSNLRNSRSPSLK
jgi:hypothetical protein